MKPGAVADDNLDTDAKLPIRVGGVKIETASSIKASESV